jgi:hypothetical protein
MQLSQYFFAFSLLVLTIFGNGMDRNTRMFHKYPTSHEIIIVTHFDDRHRVYDNFVSTVKRFVNPLNFSFVALLDKENEEDHLFDLELELTLGFRIRYNTANITFSNKRKPFYSKKGTDRFDSMGYTRKHQTSFFLDEFSDTPFIGIVDSSDARFSTYLLPSRIKHTDGRINVFGTLPTDWQNPPKNDHILTTALNTEFDLESGGRLPQFFHRSTFLNARNFVMKQLNVSIFEDVWEKWAWGSLSPINIIGNYALQYESHLYRYAFLNETDDALFPGTLN